MTKVISIGIQKGGCSKSTTTAILAYYLSQKYKVLVVDMDGQGNATQIITGIDDIFEFQGKTVYDAILSEDATDYILQVSDNLHILAGDENITTLAHYFYVDLAQQKKPYQYILKNALDKVAHHYDYILLDNPPALGEISVMSLTASDYVLIMFETSKSCYNSLKSYMRTIEAIQERTNPNLKVAGILRSIIDSRRADNTYYSELVKEEYSDLCFNTIIRRSAVVGRLSSYGIIENPEMKKVIREYEPFIKEMLNNVI